MSTHIKFCTKIEKERTEWTVYYTISAHILTSRILLSFHQRPEKNFIAGAEVTQLIPTHWWTFTTARVADK